VLAERLHASRSHDRAGIGCVVLETFVITVSAHQRFRPRDLVIFPIEELPDTFPDEPRTLEQMLQGLGNRTLIVDGTTVHLGV
jgi:hypothetical protein